MNLTLHSEAASNPDGDAVHFDVLNGAANDVIGRLRDLGLAQRGSIVMENVDTSISTLADRTTARRGRFQRFAPVWAEVEARLTTEGIFPPSWYSLLVIAGLPALWGSYQLSDPDCRRHGGRPGIRRRYQPRLWRDTP